MSTDPRALVRYAALAALGAALSACAPAIHDSAELSPLKFTELPGWQRGAQSGALGAFGISCASLLQRPGSSHVRPAGTGGRTAAWHAPCRAVAAVASGDDAAARAFFERYFVPYRVAAAGWIGGATAGLIGGGAAEGVFTGYYEPELDGARRRGGRFTVPLYMRPPDMVTADLGRFKPEFKGFRIIGRAVAGTLQPMPSRGEISAGALAGRDLEIVWVDDAVDAFFLHIQGSGRIRLRDGSVLRLGYDAANGHPYSSIGKTLLERGEISADGMSMQSIRAWLAANPGKAERIMSGNKSYVFFRKISGPGPIGAQGVALTPGRSLAVDRRFMPLGAPVWLDTTVPLAPGRPLRRLMVAQDTGSAIRGPVRGDFFWGHGAGAAENAGHMKSRGRYYLLLPRDVVPR